MKFNELRKINVNDHIEKKNGLSYLSWAWAVDTLLSHDPAATWSYDEPKTFGKTLMVFCTVKAFDKSMTAQLPVLDYRNQAIENPNAMQVNTAMQRCLAKAIALHGIGLYIYAGEDIPQDEKDMPVKKPEGVTPLAGALDHYSKEEIETLQWYADEITLLVKEGDVQLAKDKASELDSETKIAVWSLLDSKTRSSIKKG
jgi:hypothetical protein